MYGSDRILVKILKDGKVYFNQIKIIKTIVNTYFFPSLPSKWSLFKLVHYLPKDKKENST